MLHCLNTSGSCSSDLTVLERQRETMKWQQQQQQQDHQHGYFSGNNNNNFITLPQDHNSQGSSSLVTAPGFDVTSAISRTFSCPPLLTDPKLTHHSNKRKEVEQSLNTKVVAENDNKDKRIKLGAEDGESKFTGQLSAKKNTNSSNNNNNKENCAAETSNSKENSKASGDQKTDYIHVRARRGQATDSHSLAERVRREKISERMKYLQDLVPGCSKITGKAGMLDEIINYVQSLQKQVEFLSMKLATVNTRLDFNNDDLFEKEVFPTCDANATFPTMGMSSELINNPYLQFNPPQQFVSYSGLDTVINPSDMGLKRSISAPISIPETFIDSSCFSQQILPPTTWEGDFQNLYNFNFDQARATSFPSQSQLFTGLAEASNLKIEM